MTTEVPSTAFICERIYTMCTNEKVTL